MWTAPGSLSKDYGDDIRELGLDKQNNNFARESRFSVRHLGEPSWNWIPRDHIQVQKGK